MAHHFDGYNNDHRIPSPANSNISQVSDHSQHQQQHPHQHQAYGQARRDDPTRHKSTMSSASFPPKPFDEAVNTALDQAQHETPNAISPEVIAQITQSVIQQLQTGGISGPAPSTPMPPPPPQTVFVPPPPPQTVIQHPTPQSPSTNASASSPNMPNRVYTPPSPQKHPDYILHTSPEPSSQSAHMPDGPHSPIREHPTTFSSSRRVSSSLSQECEASEKEYKRPKGPARLSTGKEETTLEKIWGQLFDEEGHPTVRLSQFLRGLAVHIIEDYEPQHSIVITPHKMVKYYDDVKLPHEAYPWATVFDDENTSISRMYRDLECQHHLVQERFDQRPDIPGLTPVGFEKWVTLLIQANPDAEFERLKKAVLEMPISNPDDKKERFPKEISRRLFPGQEDLMVRYLIEDSIAEHAAIEIPRQDHLSSQPRSQSHSRQPSPPNKHSAASETPYIPQSHRPSVTFAEPTGGSAASSTYLPSHLERERKPYSNIPADSAIDDTNAPLSPPMTTPIERERKPYSAQPGGGKTYEDEIRATKPRAESIIHNSTKPSRSDSATSRARPIPISNNGPPRAMETKPEALLHRTSSIAGGRRHRSPSFSRGSTNDFRRSDGDLRSYQPSLEPGSVPRDGSLILDESDTKRYYDQQAKMRAERARRQAEDDGRHYGESPRRDYDRDRHGPRRGDYLNDEDYYRAGGRGDRANGYEYQQPYGGPVYR